MMKLAKSLRIGVALSLLSLVMMPVVSMALQSYINVDVHAAPDPKIGLMAQAAAPTPDATANTKCNNNPPPQKPGDPPILPCQKNDVTFCPKGSCIFEKYLNPAVKTVSALVGIGVTISIIIGGIQYASSADSPQKVSAAKTRIVKSIFILLAYFFFVAFLNWVIPGGINGAG